MAMCLAAGAVSAVLAINSFTLAWMHSIERVRWEEDWRVDAGQLQIVAARIKGSGAGMEPPDDAVLQGGAWHYRPQGRRHGPTDAGAFALHHGLRAVRRWRLPDARRLSAGNR